MNAKTVSPLAMLIVAGIVLFLSSVTLNTISGRIGTIITENSTPRTITKEDYEFVFWFFRVITALAASAISISIPGMLRVEYNSEGKSLEEINNYTLKDNEGNSNPPLKSMTMAESKPTIVAGGAIAVFVLVYLFNPIN